MTLPPIVERELRVASRRSTTFQIRFLAAVGAALLGGLYLLGEILPGSGPGSSGRNLFLILTGLAFTLALLAGPLLTADCISREKREGTLGFLFLTDLSGFEVVTGKFAALALVPLHGLLAVFPVAAMTVFMGGVTGGEFACTCLVISNSLFLSLSAGMWISSLVDDDRQAVGLAVGTLVLMALLPEVAAWGLRQAPALAGWDRVRLASPVGLLFHGLGAGFGGTPRSFWWALAGQHALAWLFLLIAAGVVRHIWRERNPHAVSSRAPARIDPVPGTDGAPASTEAPRLARLRRARASRMFRENPIAWLSWHDSWVRRGFPWVAGLGGLAAVGGFGSMIGGSQRGAAYPTAVLVIGGTFLLLKLLLAIHAVYLLSGQCRRGTLELLLCTPLTSRAFVDGHLAAMRHMVAWPALMLALLQVALSVVSVVIQGGDWPSVATMLLMAIVPPLLSGVAHALDFIAVAYHASRWALHYDHPSKALLRTLLLVLVLPLLLCGSGRFLVALLIIGQTRPVLERFRELAQRWFFPGTAGWAFGAPRNTGTG